MKVTKTSNIGILGSTGSIGRNVLEVINSLNRKGYEIKVKFLTANNNIETLSDQVKLFSPESVYIENPGKAEEFRKKYEFKNLNVLCGQDKLEELIRRDNYDTLLVSVVGFSGLKPTIEAIKSRKKIALANKETLVVAGTLINKLLNEYETVLIPIDSEHSAILQCLTGEDKNTIKRIVLTASGGPFRTKSIEEIGTCTVEDALKHPNWNMGNKITIDSATMMNKGLEVIEAKHLFNIEVSKVHIIIHPQSIIHSFVEFIDGSVKAQLGVPDMKIPIQYALTYPHRIQSDFRRIDFNKLKDLSFEEPDFKKFKCLKLAYEAAEKEGTYPTVLNASNEVAVNLFLNNKITFLEIADIIEEQLEIHTSKENFEIEDIYETDQKIRKNLTEKHRK